MFQSARFDSTTGQYYYTMKDGARVFFTVDPHLQTILDDLLRTYPKEYEGLLLLDATSGKILAIGGRYKGTPSLRSFKLNVYPAASLFKITTAIASMEMLNLGPHDSISYCGPVYRKRPKRWLRCKTDTPPKTTLAKAFGLSNNPAFGRLAVRLGLDALKEVAERLFYGTHLLGISTGYVEWDSVKNEFDLALLGSGFAYSYMNPIQATLLSQVMATGVVWRPYIVDRIEKDGEVVYRSAPSPLAFPVGREISKNLRVLARMTVDSGTVRRVFYDRNGRRLVPVSVGGKTGTLTSRRFKALTEWFIGFAPVERPEVVIVAFSMDRSFVNVKTSYLAMRMLQGYFVGRFVGNPVSYKRFRKRRHRRKKGG